MTETQIVLVQHSWKTLRDINPAIIGDVFYSKLFFERPSLRNMFPKSMDAQYKKLIEMLSIIVARIDKLDDLSNDIIKLAQRHQGYGVKPEHYKLVSDALIWTIQQGLGKGWNNEVKEAWVTCIDTLCDKMINAPAA